MAIHFPVWFQSHVLEETIARHSITTHRLSRPHWLRIDSFAPHPTGRIILARDKKKVSLQWELVDGILRFVTRTAAPRWQVNSDEVVPFLKDFFLKVYEKKI